MENRHVSAVPAPGLKQRHSSAAQASVCDDPVRRNPVISFKPALKWCKTEAGRMGETASR